MRSIFASNTRRWIGASALAVVVGLSGGASFLFVTSQNAAAGGPQLRNAAAIMSPSGGASAGFADLVSSVRPAVISVLIEGRETPTADSNDSTFNSQIPDLPDNNPLKPFFNQFAHGNGQPAAPKSQRFMAAGSGFAISPDGYFVTNNHVVANATKVTVQFANGDEKPATIVGTDPKTDLAVIKVAGLSNQPYVKLDDTAPRVGDWVMAMGNPFGLGGTVTAGIVSALDRNIGDTSEDSYMQIDAPVNSGNSGGPDFNLNGQVVGVNTAIFSPNGGSVGIAFAIPASTVDRITTALIKNGTVTRGFLGITIQDSTNDIASSVGLKSNKGAVVADVTQGAPADKAGIKSGDIVTAVNGQTIDDARGLTRAIGSEAPGSTADITLWRNGAEQHVNVTLKTLTADRSTSQPGASDQATAPTPTSVGITVVPNSDGPGLLIQDLDPNSVAASKGFAVGDTILDVDNKPVATVQAFQSAIDGVKSAGRPTALVKTERDGTPRYIGLPLSANS
jgi:serine protease Do